MASDVSPEYTFNIFSSLNLGCVCPGLSLFFFLIVFETFFFLIPNGVAEQNNFQSGPPDVTQLAPLSKCSVATSEQKT
jgi:hypothetical protein